MPAWEIDPIRWTAEPAQPVPASSSSAAHWRQIYFFHQWFNKIEPLPAAGGLTIVLSFWRVKIGITTLFADEPIKRAAVSISNNIAEGAERVTPSEFARFLDIAKGSAGEVRSMYRLASRLKFVSSDAAGSRCEACKSIARQLGGFAKHLRGRRNSE